jgi:hypothetical protein
MNVRPNGQTFIQPYLSSFSSEYLILPLDNSDFFLVLCLYC